MLEDLEKIPWDTLQHAYGPAADVPRLIHDLASDSYDVYISALYGLYGNIYHQGSLYEATAYAVPFLTELAQCPEIHERHHLLKYLKCLGEGGSHLAELAHYRIYDDLRKTSDYEERVAAELSWARATFDALATCLPAYASLLSDPLCDVRAAAAGLIGVLKIKPNEGFLLLQKHLDSEVDGVAAIAAFTSAGGFARNDEAAQGWLMAAFRRESEPAVKLAAAAAVVSSMGENTFEEALEVVIAGLDPSESVQEPLALLGQCGELLCANALAMAGKAAVRALPALMRAAKRRRPRYEWHMVVKAMLRLAFGEPLTHSPRPFANLSDTQKSVLRAIADLKLLNTSVGFYLERWNLPHYMDELTDYIADLPPGNT
jgi:hypothetical protein